MSRTRARAGGLLALVLLAGCMAGYTPLQRQKIYANQTTAWLEEVHAELTAKHAAADAAERAWLEAEVHPHFHRLRRTARLYILGLEAWERTGEQPATLEELQQQIQDLTVLLFELIATGTQGEE